MRHHSACNRDDGADKRFNFIGIQHEFRTDAHVWYLSEASQFNLPTWAAENRILALRGTIYSFFGSRQSFSFSEIAKEQTISLSQCDKANRELGVFLPL